MAATTEVFARSEMKYRLSLQQREHLAPIIEQHLDEAEFGKTTVKSIYFDTPQFALIERSLEKPIYKEKLRIRVYGNTVSPTMPAFVELKKKFKGTVYKRRISMTLAGAFAFMEGMPYEDACAAFPLEDVAAQEHALSAQQKQIAREIEFFKKRYGVLTPTLLISCDRCSYAQNTQPGYLAAGKGEDGLRITFDTNIRAALCSDGLQSVLSMNDGSAVIAPEEAIMEVKAHAALPFWLIKALDDTHAYKQSFSKYGTAYLQLNPADMMRTAMRKGA